MLLHAFFNTFSVSFHSAIGKRPNIPVRLLLPV